MAKIRQNRQICQDNFALTNWTKIRQIVDSAKLILAKTKWRISRFCYSVLF